MEMSSLAFSFLACLMAVGTVSSFKMLIPEQVNHPDEQCKQRGFLAACMNLESWNVDMACKNIECAAPLRGIANRHRAVCIGRAARGTHCGQNKVCYDGDCVDLPRDIDMPIEVLENDEIYKCYRPNSAKPCSW